MPLDDRRDYPAGPMPEAISRAVARRRRVIRVRRGGVAAAALLLAGSGVWLAWPQARLVDETERIASVDPPNAIDPPPASFARVSVLALRLAGPDEVEAMPAAAVATRSETVFGLRQRDAGEGPSPAS